MKYLILYSSQYGATKQIVQWIKQRLELDKKEVSCLNVKDFKESNEKYDVLVLGTPIYSGKATQEFYDFLDNGFDKIDFDSLAIFAVAMQKKACFDEENQLKFLKDYENIRKRAKIQEVLLGEMIFDKLCKEYQDKLMFFYEKIGLTKEQIEEKRAPRTLLSKKDVWDFAQNL